MSKKRILYIEDNPQNKRLVRKLLTVKGYDVLEADDGLIGVEMAQCEHPDLILMDINIPGIDGMEATARLKKSEVAHIPIIALTANAMVGDRERIMAAGCDEYMQKPVSNAVLWDTVERFIGKGDAPIKPSTRPVSPSMTTIPINPAIPVSAMNLVIAVTSMPGQSFPVPVNVLLPDSPVPLTAAQPDRVSTPSA